MRTLKASAQGVKKIKEAREEKGWTIDDLRWLDEVKKYLPPEKNGRKEIPGEISIGTWKRFYYATKPIKLDSFRACCEALGLNWKEILEGDYSQKSTDTKEFKLSNASLTLYAFHLRSSINDRVVPGASDLWEKLAQFGDILKIEELQNIRQKLICYEDNQYYPEAEDLQETEPLNLLQNGKSQLRFSVSPELKGLLCPFRLHDSYGIDLTVSSKEAIGLEQLNTLNPQYLLLPSRVEASLRQTLFFWGELLEDEGDYRVLADACVAQLIPKPEHNFIDLIAEGSFLGNPIFEYESRHKSQAKRLHILVCFEREKIALEEINKLFGIMFYVFWLRHKILYVYEQSRLCAKDAKLLSAQIEEFWLNKNFPDFLELQNMDFEYADYIRHLRDYQTTIGVNEENYRVQREKIAGFPESDFNFLDDFLSLARDKFKKQIEVDLRYLEPGKERLQQLLAIVRASSS